MYRILITLFLAAFALGTPAAAAAQSSDKGSAKQTSMPAKEKDIRTFLKITGAAELAEQSMRQMVSMYRRSMPDVPAAFWDDFLEEAKAEGLIELLVPIYDKHLSHDDIKALVKFYASPVRKRYSAALPAITSESQIAGQKWGAAIGERVARKLEEKGYQ